MSLIANSVSYSINGHTLLDRVDFQTDVSEITVIMGANGAGKSTLLSVLAGCPQPDSGNVVLAGRELKEWSLRKLAQSRVILPQSITLSFNFSVDEVVKFGSVPYESFFSVQDINDQADIIMRKMDIFALRHRDYPTLSGGERQRAQLARVMLQALLGMEIGQVYIFLDEPLAGLDIAHQCQFLEYCNQVVDKGVGIVMVVHDFNIPLNYAHSVYIMQAGKIAASGETSAVLTQDNIRMFFGVDTIRMVTPDRSNHSPRDVIIVS